MAKCRVTAGVYGMLLRYHQSFVNTRRVVIFIKFSKSFRYIASNTGGVWGGGDFSPT